MLASYFVIVHLGFVFYSSVFVFWFCCVQHGLKAKRVYIHIINVVERYFVCFDLYYVALVNHLGKKSSLYLSRYILKMLGVVYVEPEAIYLHSSHQRKSLLCIIFFFPLVYIKAYILNAQQICKMYVIVKLQRIFFM